MFFRRLKVLIPHLMGLLCLLSFALSANDSSQKTLALLDQLEEQTATEAKPKEDVVQLDDITYHVLDKDMLTEILTFYKREAELLKTLTTFELFLLDLQGQKQIRLPNLHQYIGCYLADCGNASETHLHFIYRLLGVYTRLTQADYAQTLLTKMVAIPTFNTDGVPSHKNPQIIAFGELIKQLAIEFKLGFQNIDDRIYEVSLVASEEAKAALIAKADAATSAQTVFGILTHADVVPADPKKWQLENGLQLDPYQLTEIDGKLYGRGTEDDKASIVSALLAMKAINESGVVLKRDIRLMIETTEETSGAGIEYYKKHQQIPQYNIVLDSRYPAVIAEKGPGYIRSYFPIIAQTDDVERNVISNIEASMAGNQITASAFVDVITRSPEQLLKALQATTKDFIFNTRLLQKGDFSIDFQQTYPQVLRIIVKGVSAHGSRPSQGVNPLPRLTLFLQHNQAILKLQHNHYWHAVNYINDVFGLDFHGKKLGVAYKDDFMGHFTAVPTQLKLHPNKLEVVANIRAPKGERSVEALITVIQAELNAYTKEADVVFSHNVSLSNWMSRDPSGAWLKILLDVFHQNTGLEAKPVATSGSTTAKQLPNAINFGPSLPGQKYMGHNANEFKTLENFHLDMQMFTEMIARIGTQDNLLLEKQVQKKSVNE